MRKQGLIGLHVHRVARVRLMHLCEVRLAVGQRVRDSRHLTHHSLCRLQVSLSWLRRDLLERLRIVEIGIFVAVPGKLVVALHDAVSDAFSEVLV